MARCQWPNYDAILTLALIITNSEETLIPEVPEDAGKILEELTPDDAGKIREELLPAQNHAHLLGLMMNVKPHDVETIQMMCQQPKDRLLHIIMAFLCQTEPRPTWRVIISALRSPVVNLPELAERVEATHFPEPTTAHLPPTASSKSAIDTLNHCREYMYSSFICSSSPRSYHFGFSSLSKHW